MAVHTLWRIMTSSARKGMNALFDYAQVSASDEPQKHIQHEYKKRRKDISQQVTDGSNLESNRNIPAGLEDRSNDHVKPPKSLDDDGKQRPLHNFFLKSHDQSITSEPLKQQRDPSIPRDEDAESSIPSIDHKDENGVRYKRQRLSPSPTHSVIPMLVNQPIEQAPNPSSAVQTTPGSSSISKEQVFDDPVEELNTKNSIESVTPEITHHNDPGQYRTSNPISNQLFLQLDGTGGFGRLTNIRKKDDTHSEQKQKRVKKIGRGRPPKSLLVKCSYGRIDEKKRMRIGLQIDEIMSAPLKKTIAAFKPPASMSTSEPPKLETPAKATHPFFLGTTGPKGREENIPLIKADLNNPVDDPKVPSKPPESFTTPGKLRYHKQLLANDNTTTQASYSRDVSRSRVGQRGTIEPLIPCKGIVRVGLSDPSLDINTPSNRHPPKVPPLRKSKSKIPFVSAHEDVIQSLAGKLQNFMNRDKESNLGTEARAVHTPDRLILSGIQLQEKLSHALNLGSEQLGESQDSYSKEHFSHTNSTQPHARSHNLLSRLPKHLSCFDQGAHESTLWCQKYSPTSAESVLQNGNQALELKAWLQTLKVDAVAKTIETSESVSANKSDPFKHRRKRKKRHGELDDFIVSDEESEGSVSGRKNYTVLLCGPHGSGKTATVYAVAKELGFDVFEINPSSRRSGKDIIDRVGDMARNHQVQNATNTSICTSTMDGPTPSALADNDVMISSMFKSKSKKKSSRKTNNMNMSVNAQKPKSSQQKQSLILFEEVDTLFEDENNFWETIVQLGTQSKRPIIMTCNDKRIVPTDQLNPQMILKFGAPSVKHVTDHLLCLAALEGHLLDRNAVLRLYKTKKFDVRSTISELNFWCQMGVGSTKSGLDWYMPRWSSGHDLFKSNQLPRVISVGTYQKGNEWDRDIEDQQTQLTPTDVYLEHAWREYQQHPADTSTAALHHLYRIADNHGCLSDLRSLASLKEYERNLDWLSAVDVCSQIDVPTTLRYHEILDTTQPFMTNHEKLQYVRGYQLIETDISKDYGQLGTQINVTMHATLVNHLDIQAKLQNTTNLHPSGSSNLSTNKPEDETLFNKLQSVLSPLIENGLSIGRSTLTSEIAPYVRSIAAFDLELENRRHEMAGTNLGRGSKQPRTTRASRSALEGSQRATTRRTRWFSDVHNLDLNSIVKTGSSEWSTFGIIDELAISHVESL